MKPLSILPALSLALTLSLAPVGTALGDPVIRAVTYPGTVEKPVGNVAYTAPAFPELKRHIPFEGRDRNYYLWMPDGPSNDPRPVIVLLHGAQRTGASMIDMWKDVADRHGVILVAPDALGQSWSPAADSPAFLGTVLQDAHGISPLDGRAVYLFGHSSGGILATLYANRVGQLWAGVGIHAGILDPKAVVAAPDAPPIRHYLGTKDHLFPRSGAEASAKALSDAGHEMELVMIKGHTHWYYAIGPHLAEDLWTHWQPAGG